MLLEFWFQAIARPAKGGYSPCGHWYRRCRVFLSEVRQPILVGSKPVPWTAPASTFDGMVREGLMPRPRLLGERRGAWDVRDLDLAIDRLPFDGNDAGQNDHVSSWSHHTR